MRNLLLATLLLATSLVGAPNRKFDLIENRLSNAESYKLYQLVNHLNKTFNEYCGDSYCEGDPTNLTPLAFDCTVTKELELGACVWHFVGSYPQVDEATGKIRYRRYAFDCNLGIKGDSTDLLAYLSELKNQRSSYKALNEIHIPGTTKSMTDVLDKCFLK